MSAVWGGASDVGKPAFFVLDTADIAAGGAVSDAIIATAGAVGDPTIATASAVGDPTTATASAVAAFSAPARQGCAIRSAQQPIGCESTRSTGRSSKSRSGAVVAADISAANAVAASSMHARQGCAIRSAQQPNGSESTRCSAKSRPDAVVAAARVPGRLPDRHSARGMSVPISDGCFPQAGRVAAPEVQSTRSFCGAWVLGVRGGR